MLNTVINTQKPEIKHMLLDKPIKKNDIISLKLLTGEEVIAQFQEETDNELIVSKASIVAANPQGGLGLVPWIISSVPSSNLINPHNICCKRRIRVIIRGAVTNLDCSSSSIARFLSWLYMSF